MQSEIDLRNKLITAYNTKRDRFSKLLYGNPIGYIYIKVSLEYNS